MRIEVPREAERLGAVLVHSVQKVFELDSGMSCSPEDDLLQEEEMIARIPYQKTHEIESQMAIVIPMQDERLKLVEGVLCGIPNHCLTIVLSNSVRDQVDRFALERDTLGRYARYTNKQLVIAHQKDPLLAEACRQAGYTHILDEETGLVKDGKAEGMMLATLLAWLSGRRYIGFIDADNHLPGAVLEYVREYAAGLAMSNSKYRMVRIVWQSKPKVVTLDKNKPSRLFFARRGRTSRHTNRFLNALIGEYSGFETEIIRTGNAGEHAMTIDLAMLLDYSPGYSIEPYHYINLFERFGGLTGALEKELIEEHIDIFQIESRNPHIHDTAKGDKHVAEMTYAAMQVLYHSPICTNHLRRQLRKEMQEMKLLPNKQKEPDKIIPYPSLRSIERETFLEVIQKAPFAATLLD